MDSANEGLHPAGFVSRFLAFVADLVALSLAIGAISWIVGAVERLLRPAIRVELEPVLVVALPFAVAAYYVISWTVFGQTVGKRLLGLRVVALDGGPVKLARAILRLAGYFLSAFPIYAGFAWVLVDGQRRGWHDLLAKTFVVYDARTRSESSRAPRVAPQHREEFRPTR